MSKDEPAVNSDAVQAAPIEEPAPQATNQPEAVDKDPEQALAETEVSIEDAPDEGEADEAQVNEPAAEKTSDDQLRGDDKTVAPKSENRYQKLANDNRELRDQLARLKQQESQFATEQELLNEVNPETGEYYTPQEVERIAYAQSREAQAKQVAQERYQLEVQQNQNVIRSEAQQALADFPMFDDMSKEYNPTLASQADELLQRSLVFDNGVLVGSALSPYQLYKTIYDSANTSDPKRQAQAQRATEKMLANADAPSTGSQATKTKTDPLIDGFDEEASR